MTKEHLVDQHGNAIPPRVTLRDRWIALSHTARAFLVGVTVFVAGVAGFLGNLDKIHKYLAPESSSDPTTVQPPLEREAFQFGKNSLLLSQLAQTPSLVDAGKREWLLRNVDDGFARLGIDGTIVHLDDVKSNLKIGRISNILPDFGVILSNEIARLHGPKMRSAFWLGFVLPKLKEDTLDARIQDGVIRACQELGVTFDLRKYLTVPLQQRHDALEELRQSL